jgi:hypothetical protein
MVHRDDRVEATRVLRHEHRVRGKRSGDVETGLPRGRDGRSDHVDFLATEVAGFACVRVKSANCDSRRGERKLRDEVRREDRDRR